MWRSRRNPVIGEGSPYARIMFVGEAPGYYEDLSGRPFVGAAGKVLEENLRRVGLSREVVYITNVIKCRPPGNRDPLPEEIEACTPYLDRQVKIINPDVICTLGRFAMRYMLKKAGVPVSSISRLHGKMFRVRLYGRERILAIMYHPAVALYKPPLRKVFENDFRILERFLQPSLF